MAQSWSWQPLNMVKQALIPKDSPCGIWEITLKGRIGWAGEPKGVNYEEDGVSRDAKNVPNAIPTRP
jgi:hypothetical protein